MTAMKEARGGGRRIAPARVRRAFSRASESYDAHAVLQREIAERLLAHLDFVKLTPARILDVGCGTGYFTRLLHQRWPAARIVGLDIAEPMLHAARRRQPRGGLRDRWRERRGKGRWGWCCGDGCALPFADGSFDLVCSNLAMQWTHDPLAMMAEMRRVLAPGGLMVFSTFGRRTLAELRRALAEIDPAWAGHVLSFPDVTELGDALMRLPVELTVTDADLFTLTYPDTLSLLRELKGLGASAAAIARGGKGLYGRRLVRELQARYAAGHADGEGRIRASFEALYAQAWHAEPKPHQREGVIPIRAADGPPDG